MGGFLNELLLVMATDIIGDVGEIFREGYEEQIEVDSALNSIWAQDRRRFEREMELYRGTGFEVGWKTDEGPPGGVGR